LRKEPAISLFFYLIFLFFGGEDSSTLHNSHLDEAFGYFHLILDQNRQKYPASVLLKRIQAEKKGRAAKGKGKKK
jgi:hypothetical protein